MNRQELLLELFSDERVVLLIREILRHRPTVPTFHLGKDSTEEWKFRSAERQGFDTWLTHLNINPESDLWKPK